KTGKRIFGIEQAEASPGVTVYHAGTRIDDKQLVTAGGRVLGVTALGCTLAQALQKAYSALDEIQFEGKQFRHDIGN
ncbi:MAG TPA: phosphoribosylamine--glycine ligase, partial [Ruminococcaceae bacterium]|nr:phosphoribosylamine--glycine ligase [Oscillospiraceae bacterium]